MAKTEPASDFSAEDLLRIRSLRVGGFGPLDSLARPFLNAVDLLLPRVSIAVADIKDPTPQRGRPSALTLHRRRIARCHLFREVAYSAAQIADSVRLIDRNAKRRVQRRRQKELRKATDVEAVKYRHRVETGGLTHEQFVNESRVLKKTAVDSFCLHICQLLKHRTNLNQRERIHVLGDILGVLQLGSHSPAAVRQRLRRMQTDDRRTAGRSDLC